MNNVESKIGEKVRELMESGVCNENKRYGGWTNYCEQYYIKEGCPETCTFAQGMNQRIKNSTNSR